MPVSSSGFCDPAFSAVRKVFDAALAAGDDLGGAVAVHLDGRCVVDLWGGVADRRSGRSWERDTACVTFSATKAVTAAAALALAADGLVDLSARVTQWWPEFAARGKDAVTGEHLLSHQAGLPAFEAPVSVADAADAAGLASRLAGQAPEWVPGTAHGYHATTFGWLAGELVRRVSGQSVGQYLRTRFGPGLQVGVPAAEVPALARVAAAGPLRTLSSLDPATSAAIGAAAQDPGSSMLRAMNNPHASFNDPALLTAGWPAAGLVCTARALAAFYAGLLDGSLLPGEVVHDAVRVRVDGPDRVMLRRSAFGLGFMRASELWPLPAAAAGSAFGHPGASGALGLGDLDCGVAIGYVPNLYRPLTGDPRAYRLVEAVYSSL